jgi:uncharacterized protein (TIGR00730 family)
MTAPTDSKGSCAVNVIAVYGSSRITPADPEYADALEVGRLLGAAGYTIMTGGYAGVMEAASRGAAEAGARVIGVTTAAIEALAGRRANPWLTEEVAQDLFSQRIDYLVRRAQGFVAMPGGIGTLHEIVAVWEMMRVGEIPPAPIVCYSPYWEDILKPLLSNRYLHPDYVPLLRFASTPAAVADAIQTFVVEDTNGRDPAH